MSKSIPIEFGTSSSLSKSPSYSFDKQLHASSAYMDAGQGTPVIVASATVSIDTTVDKVLLTVGSEMNTSLNLP